MADDDVNDATNSAEPILPNSRLLREREGGRGVDDVNFGSLEKCLMHSGKICSRGDRDGISALRVLLAIARCVKLCRVNCYQSNYFV